MFITGSASPTGHPKLHTYEEGYMLPVLSADDLLFSSRHKGIMRQFRDLLAVAPEAYDTLYAPLLRRFFEFVQVLPEKQNGVLGSLLNYGLARTAVALQQLISHQHKIKVTPLIKYAVFTAALLKDIGRVISQQHITIVDADGNYLQDWNPMSGPMLGQGEFYKIYQISQRYLRIESEATPLLARQLIPREGFLWLSSDVAIFSDWLAALLDEEGVAGKQITWTLALIKQDDLIHVLTSLDGASVDMHAPEATKYGEAFLAWLKEQLEAGELEVNSDEASIYLVEQGVFLEKKLFKQFADLSNMPVNWQVVFTQFGNMMGIPQKCGDDFLNAQYFSAADAAPIKTSAFSAALGQRSQQSFRNGMLLGDPGQIFMNAQIPATTHLLKEARSLTPDFHLQPPAAQGVTSKVSFDQKSK